MAAYYNEFDPFAAAWLRELIKDGLIADGVVDERSITEVEPNDIKEFTQCHFFAGIGGWSLAARLAGWSDDRPMWTGSPPCQPFSTAGSQKGQSDSRHLWPEFFRLIGESKPKVVFGEQVVTAINHGWLDEVHNDFERANYSFAEVCIEATVFGAHHKRERLFFVGYSNSDRCEQGSETSKAAGQGHPINTANWYDVKSAEFSDGKRRVIPNEPSLLPLANGIPNRVGMLRGAGNAIVPQVAAEVIKAYIGY